MNIDEQELIDEANVKLTEIKTSKELVELVDNYFNDKFNIGFPIYFVSKKAGWLLYDGQVIDEFKVKFLNSNQNHNIVDVRTAYKFYKFYDKCR